MSLLNRVKNAIFKSSPATEIGAALTPTTPALLSSSEKWRTVRLEVDPDWQDARLDRFMTKKFDISASLVQKLIRTRKIWIERSEKRVPAQSSLRVKQGDSVNLAEFFLPPRKEAIKATDEETSALEAMKIFENEEILVLNKKSGLAVHSGPGIKVSVDSLLQAQNSEFRLIHRLDRGTSGVLLVGKSRTATEKFQNLFSAASEASTPAASLKKTYLAVVAGIPKVKSGRIETLLYKASRSIGSGSASEAQMTSVRTKRADLMDEGSVAITNYRVISAHQTDIGGVRTKLALVEFQPQTGRTHQLRVHAAEHLGCPIVGDDRYGLTKIYNLSKISGIGQGLHLHCKGIAIPSEKLAFSAPIPRHFVSTLNKFPIYIKPPRPGHFKK